MLFLSLIFVKVWPYEMSAELRVMKCLVDAIANELESLSRMLLSVEVSGVIVS
jgi:hypothetical protein